MGQKVCALTWGLFSGPPQACWYLFVPILQPPGGHRLIYHVLSGASLLAHRSHPTRLWPARLPDPLLLCPWPCQPVATWRLQVATG